MGEPDPLDYELAAPPSAEDRIACWVYAIVMAMYFGAAAWCGYRAATDDGPAIGVWIVFGVLPTAFFGLIFAWALWRSLRKRRR